LGGPRRFLCRTDFGDRDLLLAASRRRRPPYAARACGGIATLMAVWWMTEALPLEATALLPLVLLPLTGVYIETPFKRAAAPFADPAIFLFLGGFMIALAIERWGLHRRLALLTLLAVGISPARLVGGFLLATGVVSMWISNTATTVMMLPIGLSVVKLLMGRLDVARDSVAEIPPRSGGLPQPTDAANFASALLLGIAYAASLGGFATLVGTPPNIFFAGCARTGLPIDWPLDAVCHAAVGPVLADRLVAHVRALPRAAEDHSRWP
jgi:sodium-dependent dicarboxylate transporter 2/3/5